MDEQLLPDEKTEKRNSNFKRREQKTYYVNDSKRVDNDFNKIIIPFQFELNKYDIKESEVSFYDNKEYLFNTINYFNSLDSFKIDSNYHPTCLQKLSLFIPSMIVFIILLYISFILLALFSLNPVLVYGLYIFFKKIYHYMKVMHNNQYEKYKSEDRNKHLQIENQSEQCKKNFLTWHIGKSGYWLELEKKTAFENSIREY